MQGVEEGWRVRGKDDQACACRAWIKTVQDLKGYAQTEILVDNIFGIDLAVGSDWISVAEEYWL